MEITVNNANDMFSEGLWKIKIHGQKEDSRNGPVLRIPEPVLTTVKNPMQRVLFFGPRDANPIFHLMEAIWMLAGRRDVEFPQLFNSRIGQYSDDGLEFNAAYGWRMRSHFGEDQLVGVIEKLKADPNTRQAVVQLWDPLDLNKQTLDRACNMQLIFDVSEGRLNMLVINRSNDFWYGYAGANIVHMTMIQEFVAGALGLEMGVYRTFSNNLHLYTELYDATQHMVIPPNPEQYDQYRMGLRPRSMGVSPSNWMEFLQDCKDFCHSPFSHPRYRNSFFQDTAYPMAMVSNARKKKLSDGMSWVDMVEADDWRLATDDWVERREAAKAK